MWGEGDDLACRGHPLDPPCLQPCGQFREGSLPCARCGGHCCPSPLCASLCRVGWGVGRMTAGTVVITGGILATVILLCIIAVLCYCRLQVSPPGLWAVATCKPLPHYGDGSQRPSSGVTKPKAMECRRRESGGREPGTIRRKLCVPHTLRTLGQPQRACWEGSGPLYCAPCTSETSGVVGRAPFWGHPRPCPQCDSYAPPSLPPCVSQPRPGATALAAGEGKGKSCKAGSLYLWNVAPGVEFDPQRHQSAWHRVLGGAGAWVALPLRAGISPQASLPTVPSVLLLQEEQSRGGCRRGGGGGGARAAHTPRRAPLQCLQLPGPGWQRRPGASHRRALRPAVRGGRPPLHRLLPVQLPLLHTDSRHGAQRGRRREAPLRSLALQGGGTPVPAAGRTAELPGDVAWLRA